MATLHTYAGVNVSAMQRCKVSEIAGVKLDNDVNVVAFKDGREIPLPPGTGYVDANGKFNAPGELVEGYTRTVDDGGGLFGGKRDAAFSPPNRFELDLENPAGNNEQEYAQTLLDDPDQEGLQPALPDDFDLEALAAEVAKQRR
ncbi:hypothetical protein FOA52_007596 [Chlamydomonas sp. UWO 241]|nr:hypothetical protein FOA52_007596 [Chlamydomonas sp. UWO 241]